MNRTEFTSLPASVALGLLWDNSAGIRGAMENIEAPSRSRSPKYDQAIWRRDGVMYASECDVEALRYWHQQSLGGKAEYAEQNAKRAKSLSFWITWREENPTAEWSGERNHVQVTAKAPRNKPEIYPRDAKPETSASTGGGSYSYDDAAPAGTGTEPEEDYPFCRLASGPLESWNRGTL